MSLFIVSFPIGQEPPSCISVVPLFLFLREREDGSVGQPSGKRFSPTLARSSFFLILYTVDGKNDFLF